MLNQRPPGSGGVNFEQSTFDLTAARGAPQSLPHGQTLAGGPTRLWYHLTARGNEQRFIFRDGRDREHFLELLAQWVNFAEFENAVFA